MAGNYDVVALPGDRFVTTISPPVEGEEGIPGRYAQVFSQDGTAVGEPTLLDTNPVGYFGAEDGSFAIVSYTNDFHLDLVAQRYDAAGAAVGEAFTVDNLFNSIGRTPTGGALAADGHLHIGWNYGGDLYHGPSQRYAVFDADGAAVVAEKNVNEPYLIQELPGGIVVSVTDAQQYGNANQPRLLQTSLEFRTTDGEPLGEPVIVPGLHPYHAVTLADGSLALFGNYILAPNGTTAEPAMIRVDEKGAMPDGPIILDRPLFSGLPYISAGPGAGFDVIEHSEYVANQDGGFTYFWSETTSEGSILKYQAFEANGDAITGARVVAEGPNQVDGSAVAMDNGSIVIVSPDGDEDALPETHLIDIPATHTAAWGGKVTAIETWQQQELLTRQDGTHTAVERRRCDEAMDRQLRRGRRRGRKCHGE